MKDHHQSLTMIHTEVLRPFSENETQMIKEFCETHNFKIALNYHSYSNLFLYPWGYTPEPCPDDNVFSEYAKRMTADNHYTYGPGSTTIYPTNGGSDDWMYGEQSTKEKILSWTPEVGNGGDGFWPQVSRIIPLCVRRICFRAYLLHVTQEHTVRYWIRHL
jgi:carboxypeptidase T